MLHSAEKTSVSYLDSVANMKNPLILFIAGKGRAREETTRNLAREGFTIVEASSLSEATALLQSQQPDLILCSMSLSSADRAELLHCARKTRSDLDDVPLLLLTDRKEREPVYDKIAQVSSDPSEPIDAEALLSAVRSHLIQADRAHSGRLEMNEGNVNNLLGPAHHSLSLLESVGSMFDCISRGYLVLDCRGLVQSMNDTAEAIIESHSGLTVINGKLEATEQLTRARLSRLIQAMLDRSEKSGAMAIPRKSSRPLMLQIFALDSIGQQGAPAVAILIQDPETRPTIDQCIVAQMYSLTRTEVRLALAMVEGMRMDQIATAFGISQSTVAFHLKNLFRKTGTSRQADLIALLIQSAATYRPCKPQRPTAGPARPREKLLYA